MATSVNISNFSGSFAYEIILSYLCITHETLIPFPHFY